jgi:uncharacterized membrane protein
MTKSEFLNQLKSELKGVPQNEIDDIIRDQEEMIREAVTSGRTEDSVLRGLGHPLELAKNLKAEIKIVKADEQKNLAPKMKAVLGAIGALLVLAPFNLIFVLGPFMALVAVILSGWIVAAALAAVSFIMFWFSLTNEVIMSSGFSSVASILFLVLSALGLSCVFVGIMYFVSLFAAKITIKYLKWNFNFINKQAV